jgi:hypothetical protein
MATKARVDKHERDGKMSDEVGHLVITDVVEQGDGGATYKFDLDDRGQRS